MFNLANIWSERLSLSKVRDLSLNEQWNWCNIGVSLCVQLIWYETITSKWFIDIHPPTHTDLLQAAGTPAGHAAERPYETDDLPVHVVLNLHVEAAKRAAAVPGAAVVLLFGLVDLLAQTVLYLVLVVGLKPNECWERLEGDEEGNWVEMVKHR